MADIDMQAVQHMVNALDERIKTLETKVTVLEAAPAPKTPAQVQADAQGDDEQ